MPIGVTLNSISALAGGVLGCLMARFIPKRFQDDLPILFGYSAMAIGINSIVDVQNMAVVVMSVILGYCIGSALHLEERAETLLRGVVAKIFGKGEESGKTDLGLLVTVAALFCFSGFGWYGALMESIAGNSEILISKSVLDFFTAALFAVLIGKAICILPFAQFAVTMVVFLAGVAIAAAGGLPEAVLDNLSACGGLLTLATGFRVAKIKNVPIFDMVPALVLVFPLSLLML